MAVPTSGRNEWGPRMSWLVRGIIGLAVAKLGPQLQESLRSTDFGGKLRETGRALHHDHQDTLDAKARLEEELGRPIAWDDLLLYLNASVERYRHMRDTGAAMVPLADWIAGKR